ncbi:hypothetical protein TeGR_g5433 [Tetraparma gracilis]|uniref:Uncharacterized protein n=1 Tax=Tetraparma gracilis TaxID=2962635 RepID=A0ABQ6N7A6_9STRA|nr:hypothetical protein TeGR_g5433 [Tetraparma gracilis]
MYYHPGLVEVLKSIAENDDHELQANSKELLKIITPAAAILPPPPPLLPPQLAPPTATPAAPPTPSATTAATAAAAEFAKTSRKLEDIHRDVRGQPTAELETLRAENNTLRAENGELRHKCAELQAKMGGVEWLPGGSASTAVDLTSGDDASVTPTPGKRSALSLFASEREESGRAVKKIKTEKAAVEAEKAAVEAEKAAVKEDLEDTQDDYQLQITHTHNQETEIDALKARIRELERAA